MFWHWWAAAGVAALSLCGCGGYAPAAPVGTPMGAATAVPRVATAAAPVPEKQLGFSFPRLLIPAAGRVMPAPAAPAVATLSDGFDEPVAVVHAPGDPLARLFIIEQAGRVRVWQAGQLQPTPFLDITGVVERGDNEQGLLGLAFAPNFAQSRWFWVYYTARSGESVLARYRVSTDLQTADPTSEQVALRLPAREKHNHNGGALAFGADGYLYLGLGDGGGAGDPEQHGQNPQTLLGKVLRLAVETSPQAAAGYTIPPDNPFADGQAGKPEIWLSGVRNPWRFSFDSANGDFYLADVGQQQLEEVNYLPLGSAGANLGWAIWEGNQCYAAGDCSPVGMTAPVLTYPHDDGSCAVVGGVVYRGMQLPNLRGRYLFGDYCTGKIWWAQPGVWQPQLLLTTQYGLASFGSDAAGEVYWVNRERGELLQLVPLP